MNKPRCIPGCMAIIFNDLDYPELNNGIMVKVVEATDAEGIAQGYDWLCEPLQSITVLDRDDYPGNPGFYVIHPNDPDVWAEMRDCELWPILPPPQVIETKEVLELEV